MQPAPHFVCFEEVNAKPVVGIIELEIERRPPMPIQTLRRKIFSAFPTLRRECCNCDPEADPVSEIGARANCVVSEPMTVKSGC
jgi:hypothetical protein